MVAAPFVLAGCSDAKSAEKARPAETTEAATENNKLDSSGDSLPKDWPQGLATPEGASVTSVISEGDVVTASGTSPEDPITLAKQFATSLKADGWTQAERSSDENSMVVEDWKQGKVRAQVLTIQSPDGATFILTHNPG